MSFFYRVVPNYSLKRTAAGRLLCYHAVRGSRRLAQALGVEMQPTSMVVGRVYFHATYQDPGLTRPIILSFEYLGKDIYGEPAASEESRHYFNFLPPFHALDENGNEIEEHALHVFTQESIGALQDLDGLLQELASRKIGWSSSGRQPP